MLLGFRSLRNVTRVPSFRRQVWTSMLSNKDIGPYFPMKKSKYFEDLLWRKKIHESMKQPRKLVETCIISGVDAKDKWGGTFEWDSEADRVRSDVFGIHSYRANQREIINAVMSGRDVLVIMGACGGKSLCYQLPAYLRNGIALVVSPLLSLIQDQVMSLSKLGIPARMFTSTTNVDDEEFIYDSLEKGGGELKLLYVTPEKISQNMSFMSKLEKCHHAGRLSLIAVDEAHYCSEWGHEFRPDYMNLDIFKTQFPTVPIIALTAIANARVQDDLMKILRISNCVKFVITVNRPNIIYRVREKPADAKEFYDDITEFIKRYYPNGESGIIYCPSRANCERVAKELRQRGIKANYYHSDMSVEMRDNVYKQWSNGDLQVIVGTIRYICS